MTRLEITAASGPARETVLVRITEAVRLTWKAIETERRLRATIRELHVLNDRTLRDIGLERADIEARVRERRRHG